MKRSRLSDISPELEFDAEALFAGLAALPPARRAEGQRHAARLRFALARVEELRRSARAAGGVFEPARLDVALSILAGHARRAESFMRGPGPARRPALAVPQEFAADDTRAA